MQVFDILDTNQDKRISLEETYDSNMDDLAAFFPKADDKEEEVEEDDDDTHVELWCQLWSVPEETTLWSSILSNFEFYESVQRNW